MCDLAGGWCGGGGGSASPEARRGSGREGVTHGEGE